MALRTAQMLSRWAAQFPGTRMPDSLEGLSAGVQIQLQQADPELFQLLNNSAPAELELAALSGQLGDAAIPQADREAAERRAEAERLIAEGAFPTAGTYEGEQFIPGNPGNLTAQLTVQLLAPDLYEREMAKAQPPAPQQGLTAESAAYVNTQLLSNYIGAA